MAYPAAISGSDMDCRRHLPDEMSGSDSPRLVSARMRLVIVAAMASYSALLSSKAAPIRSRPSAYTAPFLVYYGLDPNPAIANYQIAVLDSETRDLGKRNRLSTRLGYRRVGEGHVN